MKYPGMKIVFVDDSLHNRDLIREFLLLDNFDDDDDINLFDNPRYAMEHLTWSIPDKIRTIVIAEFNMYDLNGDEMLDEINKAMKVHSFLMTSDPSLVDADRYPIFNKMDRHFYENLVDAINEVADK